MIIGQRAFDDQSFLIPKQTSYCSNPFTEVGVLWNGDVTLCSLDQDGQLTMPKFRVRMIVSKYGEPIYP